MSDKPNRKHYKLGVKLEAIRLFEEEGKTRAQITAELGLASVQTVKRWLRIYRHEGQAGLQKPRGRKRPSVESEQSELERLRMENELLKKFHTELRQAGHVQRNIGSSTTTAKDTR